MRLIDADKANVDEISCYYGQNTSLDDVEEWLNDQPTVDSVKRGRWVKCTCGVFECSNCKLAFREDTDYCPHCGAKMDLEDN